MDSREQEVIAIVRASYEAFNRGDFEEAARAFHPDIVWNRTMEVEQPVRGADAARELMEPEIFSSQRTEIHTVEVIGEYVLVDTTFHAVGAGSGIELDQRGFHLWRMRDNAAIEFRAFNDRGEALAAAREG